MRKILVILLFFTNFFSLYSQAGFEKKSFQLPELGDKELIKKMDFHIPLEITGILKGENNGLANLEAIILKKNKRIDLILSEKEKREILSCISRWRFKTVGKCKVRIRIWIGRPLFNSDKKTIWNKLEIFYFTEEKKTGVERYSILKTNLIRPLSKESGN